MRARTTLGLLATSIVGASAACTSTSTTNPSVGVSSGLTTQSASVTVEAGAPVAAPNDGKTKSPIKHVLVIIGENRSFDHVFATYQPKNGQRVDNLLSKGIVNADGSPGPNFARAIQNSAVDSPPSTYELSPPNQTPYSVLPPVLAGGPKTPYVSSLAQAESAESLALPASYVPLLLTGATGLKSGTPDTRLAQNPLTVPPGPFSLSPGITGDDYSASPVHRFYQMWQQIDCSVDHATPWNPSGCTSALFPWVEATVGAGANGSPPPAPSDAGPPPYTTSGEGAASMGFYNIQKGDAPYFKSLVDTYAMSDNFHQAIQGGTMANHIALGTGDADWYSDGNGNAITPPALDIEDPDPQASSNNWYTQDGYSGGSYTNCSDETAPGVKEVASYLHQLGVKPNCDKDHYYIVNNYNPGYFGNGELDTVDPFTMSPATTPTIGNELSAHDISWRFYGEDFNAYVADPEGYAPGNEYCNICNPFQYNQAIMTTPSLRANLKDLSDLYSDISNGFLPAFAITKPSGLLDGHPASSKLDLFEGYTKNIIDAIQAQPALWKDTAIFITFDEGGGYWDSGYIAPVDFFGDGTRIPLITVSPYATGGHISHNYSDHVSILKFVEKNWGLPPITGRSRDNLPNPFATPLNPYVPLNGPSIDDLADQFDFGRHSIDTEFSW
jgi:phospholipase C